MIMSRVYNFSAGPAVLPEEVLKEAADEMLDYQGSGQSVRSEEHTSELQSRQYLVGRLLLEKKKKKKRWDS